ncbi:TonB-dependent receptor [Echinicola sediminis]
MMKNVLLLGLTLLLTVTVTYGQGPTIRGTVTSGEDGSPVPGASVLVKGTTKGVATDLDGAYSITLSAGQDTLVFSFVGMMSKEVSVGNQSIVDVELEPDVSSLTEVIVTGYLPETRDRLSGAIGTVSSKEIEDIPVASFDQILQGRSPGLYVTAGSGQPGASARVRIRGEGSINGGNTPLYIMDGVPIEAGIFATLNPNDIADVSVLKDASATAVYGSRGANGVIVITTKKGNIGRPTFNYNVQAGFATQAREKFDMMNSAEKIMFEEMIGQGPTVNMSEEEKEELRNTNTDWKDVFLRTGRTVIHEFNASGGSEMVKYYASLNYYDQQGQALRSGLERYTTRFNIQVSPSEKVEFGMNSAIGFSKSDFIESESSITLANPFAAVYLANPYEVPFDEETGNIVTGTGRIGSNALDRIYTSTDGKNEFKGTGAVYLAYSPIEQLVLKSNLGIDYIQQDFERWVDPESFAGTQVGNGNQGVFSQDFSRKFSYISTTSATYNNTFGNHSVTGLGAFEINQEMFDSFGFSGFGINPKLPETPAGITPGSAERGFIPTVSGGKSEAALLSYFLIGNYTYKDKYNFKASIRRDGSSRFGEEKKYVTLWSVGGSWNIMREDFLSESLILDQFRLRTSYGVVGNQEGIGFYQSIPTYASVTYAGNQGIAPAAIGNPQLQWELSNQFNVGFDVGLFGKLMANIDLYNNLTTRLFVTRQLSRTTGFVSLESNDGKVRNRGVELNLEYNILSTRDFSWSVGGNIAYNDNEIRDLGQVEEFEQGTSIIRVGLPLGSHYIVKWAGVNPTNGEPLYYDAEGNVTNVYSADNSVADFGTYNPPTTGGFNTEARYKGLSLGVFFTFADGYSRFNNQRFFQENPAFVQFNLSRKTLSIWQEPGDITDIQSFQFNREFSSYDIEDASYLRLRNVILSYSVPKAIVNKTKFFRSISVFAQGQNLFTWTKFTGFDPEDSNNIAQYEYPASKVFTGGIDVTF